MLIDWTGEFDGWLDRLTGRARSGDQHALAQLARVNAAFTYLSELSGEPVIETPTLRRVRQSGRYPVWRVGHPYTPNIAVRMIVWFPPEQSDEVVVVLFGADKARMGDVFYDSVGTRADAAIGSFRKSLEGES